MDGDRSRRGSRAGGPDTSFPAVAQAGTPRRPAQPRGSSVTPGCFRIGGVGESKEMAGDPIATMTARSFQLLSRVRRKRIFHPHGVGFEGRLIPRGGDEAPFGTEPRDALVRLSRSLGLPERFHGPCGLGVRIPDLYGNGAHHDLLMVSSSRVPGGRHLL